MKSLLKTSLFALSVLAGGTLTSCEQDKCASNVCANNGTCNTDGSCTCPVGYEGNRCETVTREKFKGSWNVFEDGSMSNKTNYTLSVQDGGEIDQVFIRNFNNFSNSIVVAKVVRDTMYIPLQNIEQAGKVKQVEGKGYFLEEKFYKEHGEMRVKYRVIDEDGNINDYGYKGGGMVSEWSK